MTLSASDKAAGVRSALGQFARRARRPHRLSLGLVLLSALCLVLFVWPVLMLVYGAFRSAPPDLGGQFSAHEFLATLSSGSMWAAFGNSILLSGSTVILSTALALYLAWTVTRTDTPLRRIVTPMMVMTFAVPPLFFTLSWAMLGEQPVGIIDKALHALFGATPFNAQSWYGMIGVSVLAATAAEYLLLLGPFLALDRSLEEAALVCGARRLRAFFTIEVPALAPSILGVMILGFVLGLGFLTVPLLLGEPAGIYVLPTEIYRLIDGTSPANYAGASTLSLLLIAVVVVLVALQHRLIGRRSFTTMTGKAFRRERIRIGRWRYLGTAVIVVYGLLALVLPLGQFVLGSFEPYFGVYKNLTLANYRTVLQTSGTGSAFWTTVVVSVAAGFCASCLAVWIALVAQRSRSRLRRLPELSLWLLWAVPGITLSLGIIWAYLSVPGLKSLYATEWIVLLALVVGTAPIASRALSGPIGQIARELEEAARTSGASAFRATVGILLRLVLPAFAVSWFLAGVVASGNLDIPILLSSPTNQTVPLVAYDLYDNGSLAGAAAVFCLLLAGIASALVLGALVRALLAYRSRRHAGLVQSGAGVLGSALQGGGV
jgi:iron(III) transport system permease protein